MDFQNQINFLTALQKNNNKEWMDANRKWYKEVREDYISWLDQMNARLAALIMSITIRPAKRNQ